MAHEYELLDVITREQLRALQSHYARRQKMYVPRELPAQHAIVRLIGPQAAKKLSDECGGILFSVTRSLLVRARNEAIRSERGWGLPPRLVARRYGLSVRSVRNICQGYALRRGEQPFGLRRRQWRAELQGLESDDRQPERTAEPPGRSA